MMNTESLKEFIRKYQTGQKNIVREYIQHLFLASLYKIDGSEKLLFKGGTALRLIYLSPRFSEDLDFTGQGISHYTEIEDVFISALSEMNQSGIDISFKEAKTTSGGYLGIIHYDDYDISEDMKFEISLRKSKITQGELVTISSEFVPPYILMQINPKELVSGKIAALLSRRKPRDYYDLYFLLRNPQLSRFIDKKKLKLASQALKQEKIDFKRELSILLPASHHKILKNFHLTLLSELNKHGL